MTTHADVPRSRRITGALSGLFVLILPFAPMTAAQAQSAKVDAADVNDCYAYAEYGDRNPECLGAASNACQMASADGSTTQGIVACLQAETDIWDGFLNGEYKELQGQLKVADEDGGSISRVDALRDAQRAWIAFRDADCMLAYAQYQDGTIRSVISASCVMRMTAERTLTLRDMRQEGN
jgi:uncharacterized protein YecT (DUF1311 family)